VDFAGRSFAQDMKYSGRKTSPMGNKSFLIGVYTPRSIQEV
jgi:hypothetical protein